MSKASSEAVKFVEKHGGSIVTAHYNRLGLYTSAAEAMEFCRQASPSTCTAQEEANGLLPQSREQVRHR